MISKRIDYIDDPEDTVDQYLQKALKYNFRCIFANLDTYETAVNQLKDSDIIIAGAIDFPEGIKTVEEQLLDFGKYAEKGFREIDYVLNQRAVEMKNYNYIYDEMSRIADFCRSHGITDKCIVEMCKLEGDESAKATICDIANKAHPCYLKTSTGRSVSGAKLNDVSLMRQALDQSIKIKAAGGIHTYTEASAFIDAGADILGASAGIAIVEGETK